MKKAILFAAMSVFLFACSSNNATKDKENMELVANYIKAVENMDFEGMGKYLDDKYMGMGPSYGDTIYKPQAVANWKENVTNLYEKIHYNRSFLVPVSIPDGPNKGEWVVDWAELHINYKKGGDVTIWANTSYKIENGKIIKSITLYNEADALRQLGYKIVPPGAAQE
jgi:predicted ester cyclase